MSTPGSSGRDGLTPISVVPDGSHDGEQARPSFRFGMWHLSLGDRVRGIHRLLKREMIGSVVLVSDCVCISTSTGVFPIQSIAVHEVSPPLATEAA